MSAREGSFLESQKCKKDCKGSRDCARYCKFSSDEIKKMSLADFEKNFGFQPVDKAEKIYFSESKKRLIDVNRRAAIANNWDLTGVVFA